MARNPNISAELREKVLLAMGNVVQTDVSLGMTHQGKEITPELRDELLAKCQAGQFVELELSMLAYEQEQGVRNRNNVRLRDGAIMKMAQSCVGRPFLKDHQQHDSEAVQGIITNSVGEKLADGKYKVNQKVSLRDPKAVARALRGLMSTVSISWRATGDVCCSVCKTPVFTDCYHWPGDKVKQAVVDGKPYWVRDRKMGTDVVEWVYNDAEGLETSEVPVPAVKTAKINDIKAQIMLAAGMAADDEPDLDLDIPEDKTEKNAMDPKDKEIADLKALNTRLSAIASLSGPEKAHFDRLGTAGQDTFLSKSTADRAEMTKVVHTDRKGRQYFASDDSRLVEMAKDADEAYAEGQKQLAEARQAGLAGRASTELAHLSGTIEQRTALLAAVEGIADKDVREACLKMVKEYDAKQARFFNPSGRGQTKKTITELNAVDPDEKLQELADKLRDESDKDLTPEQAFNAVMETPEGAKLYAESEAIKAAARGN